MFRIGSEMNGGGDAGDGARGTGDGGGIATVSDAVSDRRFIVLISFRVVSAVSWGRFYGSKIVNDTSFRMALRTSFRISAVSGKVGKYTRR